MREDIDKKNIRIIKLESEISEQIEMHNIKIMRMEKENMLLNQKIKEKSSGKAVKKKVPKAFKNQIAKLKLENKQLENEIKVLERATEVLHSKQGVNEDVFKKLSGKIRS